MCRFVRAGVDTCLLPFPSVRCVNEQLQTVNQRLESTCASACRGSEWRRRKMIIIIMCKLERKSKRSVDRQTSEASAAAATGTAGAGRSVSSNNHNSNALGNIPGSEQGPGLSVGGPDSSIVEGESPHTQNRDIPAFNTATASGSDGHSSSTWLG